MRNALVLAVLLLPCCSSTPEDDRPEVAVTAVEETEGVRVLFDLRKGDVTAHEVKIEVENGEIRDLCRSSDLRRVSVLWIDDEGKITATFPYGQTGVWESGGTMLSDEFLYVFHESENGRVTTRIPRGAPVRPRLLLHVEVPKKSLPARLQWPGRVARDLVKESSLIGVALPISERGVLEAGAWKLTLTTKTGTSEFVLGVDKDGTPTATTGYVRRAP